LQKDAPGGAPSRRRQLRCCVKYVVISIQCGSHSSDAAASRFGVKNANYEPRLDTAQHAGTSRKEDPLGNGETQTGRWVGAGAIRGDAEVRLKHVRDVFAADAASVIGHLN
jgi:hypothetical protein